MNQIVGMTQRKKGSFKNEGGEEISYDNVVFYFISDENPDINGCTAGEVKIKFENLSGIFGSDKSSEDFYGNDVLGFIGKYVSFNFMMTNKVPVLSGIRLADPPVKSDKSVKPA